MRDPYRISTILAGHARALSFATASADCQTSRLQQRRTADKRNPNRAPQPAKQHNAMSASCKRSRWEEPPSTSCDHRCRRLPSCRVVSGRLQPRKAPALMRARTAACSRARRPPRLRLPPAPRGVARRTAPRPPTPPAAPAKHRRLLAADCVGMFKI